MDVYWYFPGNIMYCGSWGWWGFGDRYGGIVFRCWNWKFWRMGGSLYVLGVFSQFDLLYASDHEFYLLAYSCALFTSACIASS